MSRRGENIYKRKDGRWEGRYRKGCIGSKTIYGYIYGKSYAYVKQRLIEEKSKYLFKINENGYKDDLFTNISKLWLDSCKNGCKESTQVKYKNMLEDYILPILGNYCVSKIKSETITTMCKELLLCGGKEGTGLSSKTIYDVISILRGIRKFAISEQYQVGFDIADMKLKKEQKELRVFDSAEQLILCDFLLQNMNLDHLGILLCLYTGIRVGELCALRWEDISLERKLIHIHKTMLRIQTDNEATKTKILITSPKSLCSIRTIPIQDNLITILSEYKKSSDAYLLTGLADHYVEPRTMQYRYKVVLKKCGIADANFHALRHTFATRCVEAGFDVKSLSEILGHSSVNITLNRYVHPTMDLKRNNMNKLLEYFAVK